MPGSSYEMIEWIPFDNEMPPENTPLMVWGEEPGVQFAIRQGQTIQPEREGFFSHWATRPVGASQFQQLLDSLRRGNDENVS